MKMCPYSWGLSQAELVPYYKKEFQRATYKHVSCCSELGKPALVRLRQKVEAVHLLLHRVYDNNESRTLRTIERSLKLVGNVLPPRVWFALYRAWWNGWCTPRRFQQTSSCCFCVSENGEQSLKHFAFCSTIRSFFCDKLNIALSEYSPQFFYAAPRGSRSEAFILRCALCLHSVYKLFNDLRHQSYKGIRKKKQILLALCRLFDATVKESRVKTQIKFS